MDEESKLKIEQEVKSEYEGTFGTPIEEETTLEVKHEENSEHEGTFENEEDTMERKEVTIPVFDGEDYSMWKKRITMYLKLKKCDVVITRARATADKEDWEEKDLKAINLIYSAISNKQLEFVCEEDTAYKIIKKLDDMYLKESTALQIVCRNKLEKLRLEKYSDTATFFSDFEKSVNELKSAGAKISEKEKLNYMLNTLPSQYSYIGDLIDTLKEEDQTASYVKNKIQIAEMKNNSEHSEQKSNVFAAKKDQKGSCFKCGAERKAPCTSFLSLFVALVSNSHQVMGPETWKQQRFV